MGGNKNAEQDSEESDDANDPLKAYYKMMREKIEEQ
jgi:hypothetical protein